LFHLLGLGIAIEVTDQTGPVFGGPLGQVVDEIGDQFPTGLAEGSGAAEVSGIAFDQGGIELMLADQLAEAIAQPGLAVVRGRAVPGRNSTSLLLLSVRRPKGSEFFDRTKTDPVGLAQGPVDGPGLGHPHLGPEDKGGDIGRISVTVANEALGARRFVDRGLEDPATGRRVTKLAKRLGPDAGAAMAAGKSEEAGVGDVPLFFQVDQLSI
jgi:hypothetical protein